jgi:hypothetical protein
MKREETYVGDGLYASLDGEYVILRAPRGDLGLGGPEQPAATDHMVYLDRGVYRSLCEFAEDKAGWNK